MSRFVKFAKIRVNSWLAVILVTVINLVTLISSCSRGFKPEPLPFSIRQNLALLQTDPQFVMYFNFKKMRDTEFWSKYISDTLLNQERNFGNMLYDLKQATGASITSGIDELYFSNSWTGENALVVKGTFDRKRIDEFVESDTNFAKFKHERGVTIYKNEEKHFYFYFKDDFTVCASNYLKQIENTFDVRDTSATGLLTNAPAIAAIENILHKEHLWMMSNQKLFIRGIYENFAEPKSFGKFPAPGGEDTSGSEPLGSQMPGQQMPEQSMTEDAPDTARKDGTTLLHSIYENINAVSFALVMSDELELFMQNECSDNKSAEELKNLLDGVIALTKISTQLSKKKPSPVVSMLENIKMETHDKTVLVKLRISQKQVADIRKQRIL